MTSVLYHSLSRPLDHLYNHPELYDADRDLFSSRDLDFWRDFTGQGRVLEMGCGTGRLSVALARYGCDILAIDNSTAMLDYARQHHGREPGIQWIDADILTWSDKEPVDKVIIPLNTFNHLLTTDDQISALRNCRKALTQEGHLALETFNPVSWRPYETWTESRRIQMEQGEWVRMERHRLDGGPVFILELAYLGPHGDRIELGTPLRLIYRFEIDWLLREAGFRTVSVFGNHDRTSFTGWDPHMLIIAQPC